MKSELVVGGGLTPSERSRLAELEAGVEQDMRITAAAFVRIGVRLTEIRDSRLYRATHPTFDAYLDERWGMSRQRGYQLIDAASVSTTVDALGLPTPGNEAQARELVPLLRGEGEDAMGELWRELCAQYGEEKITAALIREAVERRMAVDEHAEAFPALNVAMVPLRELTRDNAWNYRIHDWEQILHLKRSLQANGVYRPVVLARDGTILAGHGVIRAAWEVGLTELPAVRLDVAADSPQGLKILAGDNEVGLRAKIDDRALTGLLKHVLDETGMDDDSLRGTGFDVQTLTALLMVSRPRSEIRDMNAANEWIGLCEFEPYEEPLKVVVSFDTEDDRQAFFERIGRPVVHQRSAGSRTISVWWPSREKADPSSLQFVLDDEIDDDEHTGRD